MRHLLPILILLTLVNSSPDPVEVVLWSLTEHRQLTGVVTVEIGSKEVRVPKGRIVVCQRRGDEVGYRVIRLRGDKPYYYDLATGERITGRFMIVEGRE